MTTDADPIVGNWYQHLDKGQKFTVVALDTDKRIIEIQHFDGDVEEIDLDEWHELEIEPSVAPEDWTGPFDAIESDDLGYTETAMKRADWSCPLEETKPAQEAEEE